MTFQFDTGNAPFAAKVTAHPANGFAKHGIDHLSASSVNLWVNAPDMWVAKYLHGFKGRFGPAPVRGQCVEDGVVLALQGKSVADATAAAFARFDKTFTKPDDDTAKERDLLAPMIEAALGELRDFGEPEFQDGQQEKISINADFGDWSIPVIGFLDLVYPSLGLVIDLKTTTRIPSQMSPEHQMRRQIPLRLGQKDRAARGWRCGANPRQLESAHCAAGAVSRALRPRHRLAGRPAQPRLLFLARR